MSNAKRFLSVVLAIIMVCSTLVIGANAAYTAYKGTAIIDRYNSLDKAVLTTDQYASAAMDEVDRMLFEEQLMFTRADIVVGDVDLTSIDAAMNSVSTLVGGNLFNSLKGMLGDLKNLDVSAFRPESDGGVRRGTANKTDTDIIYAVLEFLYDNKGLVKSFVAGTIDLGSIVASLIDISEFADVNKLLKGLLYEAAYDTDAPDDLSGVTFDTMVQVLIDRFVVDEFTIDDMHVGSYFAGHTNISSGSMYNFIDEALKIAYNKILIPILNDSVKREVGKFCGIEYTKNGDGTYTEDRSGMNAYASLLNVDYTAPEFNFVSGKTLVQQLNNIVKSLADVLINPAVFVWQAGENTQFKNNVVNLAKAALMNTGDDFFASYIEVADAATVNAMSAEELTAYALRAIINGSVDGMYIPEDATTIRKFGYYTLSQLLSTAVPNLDFSGMDKDSTDTLVVMGIDYAIYSISAELDMGLNYVYDMAGVEDQLTIAAQYGIDNYGGLFSGIDFSSCTDGWDLVDAILFRIIDRTWMPASTDGTFKGFLIDGLIENILDLDFDALFGLFEYRTDANAELQKTPKQVVINRVASILNTIFPGAIQPATSIDAIATNAALANTVDAVFSTLWNERVDLVKSILPTLCDILELTSAQEFEFPKLSYDKLIVSSGNIDFDIAIRNNSTGINTGWTDTNDDFWQDQLYTYQIVSVQTSNPEITVSSYPATLSAGVTENINVTGRLSSNTSNLKVTIKYNVLTETGNPLTQTPIEEDVYCFLTKEGTIENEKLTSVAAGNFSVTDGPLYYFAKSMGDIEDITMTVSNANTTPISVTPTSNLFTVAETATAKRPFDTEGNQWFEVNSEAVNVIQKVGDNNGIGKVQAFKLTDAYKALTSEEKDAVWDSIIEHMTIIIRNKIQSYPKVERYTLGVTNGTATSANQAVYLYLYKDYGLNKLVDSELTKHRQSNAYTDPAAWTAYQDALTAAVTAVYSPFTTAFAGATGKASQYETASAALEAAIEGLDACAASAGVESLQAIIDQYNPSNEDLEYDDPNYNYFAVADYKAYTYYNYRDEYKDASKMIDKATIPDKETGEVQAVSELDKAYMEHRLSLYGSRLLPTTPNKLHLTYLLANPLRDLDADWSAESWANYERALAFATAVNTETGAKQSKINTALEELREAEKRLVIGSGTPGGDDDVLPEWNFTEGVEAIDTEEGIVVTGVAPGEEYADYFVCNDACYAVASENEDGNLSTGAIVEIYAAEDDSLLATYIIAVYADIDGDGDVNTADQSAMLSVISGSKGFTAPEKIAADLSIDDDIASDDQALLLSVVSGSKSPDYYTREVN